MFSEKDFERLWFLYKTEGEPNGVSINSFCIGNNIPYTAFFFRRVPAGAHLKGATLKLEVYQ